MRKILGGLLALIVITTLALLTTANIMPTSSPTASSAAASGTSSPSIGTTPPTPQPVPAQKGIVRGTVMLGPTCPVEQNPPNPQCADKPYQTTIRVQPTNPSAPYTAIASNADGTFSTSLYPGTYMFTPMGGNSMPPTCRPQQVEVTAGSSQSISLTCDTGIR